MRLHKEPLKIDAPFTSEDIKCLSEIGFWAAGKGLVKSAEKIFLGMEQLRPHRAFPYIGKSLAYLNVSDFDRAVACLENIPQVDPSERSEIEAFLGLAYQFAGRTSESRRILERVANSSTSIDSDGKKIANAMLGAQHLNEEFQVKDQKDLNTKEK